MAVCSARTPQVTMQLQGLSPDRDVHMNEHDLRLSSMDPSKLQVLTVCHGCRTKASSSRTSPESSGRCACRRRVFGRSTSQSEDECGQLNVARKRGQHKKCLRIPSLVPSFGLQPRQRPGQSQACRTESKPSHVWDGPAQTDGGN